MALIPLGQSTIMARRRKPRVLFQDQGGKLDPAKQLLKEAVVWLQPSGIEDTAGNVTAWRNSGTLGSAGDLTEVIGTPTLDSLNGLPAVLFNDIADQMRTASGVSIQKPLTALCSFEVNQEGASGSYLFSSHTLSGSRADVYKLGNALMSSGSNTNTGVSLSLSKPSACVAVFNPSGSKYYSDEGENESVDAGTQANFDAMSLGNIYGTSIQRSVLGVIREYGLMPREVTKTEADILLAYLMR